MVDLCSQLAELWNRTVDQSVSDFDGDPLAFGANSLDISRFAYSIRRELGINVSTRAIYDASSLARLASSLASSTLVDDGKNGQATDTFVPRQRLDRLPLSSGQSALWYLGLLDPASTAYHIPLTIRVPAALDEKVLEAAIGDCVARQATLRTVYPVIDDEPCQIVMPVDEVRVPFEVRSVSPEQYPAAVVAETARPFDVRTQIPVRATLFRTGESESILLVVVHHISFDGWSVGPFCRDLADAYAARAAGRSPNWAPLPIEYADYAVWQRHTYGRTGENSDIAAEQIRFWTDTLTGLPTELPGLADRPRPNAPIGRAGVVRGAWSPELHTRLSEAAHSHRATLFMVLVAGLAEVFTRRGAGTDIPLGTATAGRLDPRFDDVVGYFVNPVTLRVDTSGEPDFAELLSRVRAVTLAAFDNHIVPFERIVEAVGQPRALGRNPLFQTGLVVQSMPWPAVDLAGAPAQVSVRSTGRAKFDLYFEFWEHRGPAGEPNGLTCSVEYSADRFDPETVRELLDHLHDVLARATEYRDAPAIPPKAAGPSLARLFERQVSAHPEAIVVEAPDGVLTYQQLNRRANQLARLLTAAGVGLETLVGVALPRSAQRIVATLGVLKAGGAYLPLDLDYPADRLTQIIDDARPVLVIAGAGGIAQLPDPLPVPMFALTADTLERCERQPDDNPADAVHRCTSANLACVLYTSGSTGRPKGVMIPHAGAAAFALDSRFATAAHHRMLMHTPFGFDVANYELWVPLLHGGQTVLLPPGRPDTAILARTIARERVSAVWLTAAVFQLIAAEDPGCLRGVQQVWSGGEAVPPESVRQVFAACPEIVFVDGYGPTEASCMVASHALRPSDRLADTVPIGRPMDGVEACVLDERLRPVAAGAVGELYVSGIRITRGYLRRPGFTATRYVASPFGPAGERVYRTGDLVRANADGVLEYLGRADTQLKVRGHRIESGEVEHAMNQHPAVVQSAVVVHGATPLDRRLIGYFATAGDLDAEDLRAHLTATLPRHMVPDRLIRLERLPLTPHGKLDRAALRSAAGTPARSVEPATIATLFEEQAARHPAGVALSLSAGDEVSYADLNQQANRIARMIIARNVGPERVVALMLPRGRMLITAILAVAKSGAAFLPIDLDAPLERIRFVLNDVRPALVIRRADDGGQWAVAESVTEQIVLDQDGIGADQWAGHDLAADERLGTIALDQPAYVLYTSGSTGTPKGVVVTHAGLAGLVRVSREQFRAGSSSRVLQLSSPGFDIGIMELCVSLLCGGVLVLAPSDQLRLGAPLVELCARQRVTHMMMAPTALSALPVGSLPSVEVLAVGAEAVPQTLAACWSPGRILLNGYGPTEATVCATLSRPLDGSVPPPIGRPIPGVRCHVLDDALRPVPADDVGELYLGGPGLARGYVNRPAVTAGRFVAAPSGRLGERMYRTGDLVRRQADGDLVYLGRVDDQVKLNGVRIELGEVETALGTHPAVHACAVTVREDRSGIRYLAAYLVYSTANAPSPAELREHLRKMLPTNMIPSAYVTVAELPRTLNGKIDRAALPKPEQTSSPRQTGDRAGMHAEVQRVWCAVLGRDSIGLDEAFFEVGGTSLLLVQLQQQLTELLGTEVDVATLFEYPTIRRFADHCVPERPEEQSSRVEHESAGQAIAVVGMAVRAPGAADLDQLWSLLTDGKEGIVHSSESRDGFVASTGVPPGVGTFDAGFFGYTAADARQLDAQQRLFLQTAWEAVEHAGYDPLALDGPTGVFAGAGLPYDWLRTNDWRETTNPAALQRIGLGNPLQFLSAHAAYKLGLRGPALTVNTACSTSLVAVHLACESLTAGECTTALAGGVSLRPDGETGYLHQDGGVLSPDGRCRPFDADSGGTISTGGAGLVVLKRLTDAVADGDTIHAVIRGSAINNDGDRKLGFTAPSVDGQAELLDAAYRAAGIDPATITYIQAHGTATALGDVVEVRALDRVLGRSGRTARRCALGSVKANVGHTDSAAGVIGLISTVLAVQHGRIPAVVHFRQANPRLDLDRTRFYVNAQTIAWPPTGDIPRRAGVTAIGLGGTNAHVVVEQAPAPERPAETDEPQVITVSARDAATLRRASARLAGHLRNHADLSLADVASTLQRGRHRFDHRRALSCRNVAQAIEGLLDTGSSGHVVADPDTPRKIVFLFPGGGSQFPGMGRTLYAEEPVYRATFDECCALFRAELGCDIGALLLHAEKGDDTATLLRRPSLNFAALLTTELAVAALLRSYGIIPAALIGHSLGEYAAAHIAGVLTLPDVVELVAARGLLCDKLPPTAVVSVPLGEDEVRPMLDPELAVAAVNSIRHCAVSGPVDQLEQFRRRLRRDGVQVKPVPIDMGAHSAATDLIADEFARECARRPQEAPAIPLVSGLTGAWQPAGEPLDPHYWVRHLRQTIRFAEGLDTVLADPEAIAVQIGPGRALLQLAEVHPRYGADRTALPTLVPDEHETGTVANLLARLWERGVDIDWDATRPGERRRRVPLPGYPFSPDTAPAVHPEPSAATEPGSDRIEQVLSRLWCELIGVAEVDAADDFLHSGGDSQLAVVFRSRIKEALGVQISAHAFLQYRTFGALLDHLRPAPVPARTAAHSPILITLRPGEPDHVPLYLVQAIGGTVYSYRNLVDSLDTRRPVHAFRAYGIEPGEPVPSTIRDAADRNVQTLLDTHRGGPIVLGGHSSGGVLAHEMARQLLDAGHPVPVVVLIDTTTFADAHRYNLRSAEDVRAAFDSFRDSAPEAWAAFTTAMDTDANIRAVIVATNSAIREHQPTSIPADLLYLRAAETNQIFDPHPESAWRQLFSGRTIVRTVPGNHFTLIDGPHAACVAKEIDRALRGVETGTDSAAADSGRASTLHVSTPSGLRIGGLSLAQAIELIRATGGVRGPGAPNIIDSMTPEP
ncbi:amino acid adenylation domain-containing protein [Nocardia brasiliensis]|uniref:amino acid adenylation domain-containing protein n=1 Tax=Nocardia brasiliensis TaxID=37326 RepID=UPI0037B59700